MTHIHHAHYTDEQGIVQHSVTVSGCAAMAATTDERYAAEYARALYYASRGAAVLAHWNGDAGTLTEIERKHG